MKKQQSSPSIKRKIVVWGLTGIILICLSLFIYFIVVYHEAIEVKEDTYSASKQKAIQNTPLIEVLSIERYNGEEAYDVIKGKTKTDEIGFAFVPINEELEILFLESDKGISESSMLSKWKESCVECELDKITLGIDKGHYIWEIIYKNRDDKYVFSYYLFSNGKLYEQLKQK